MKACSKCGSTENGFYKNKSTQDGLASWCKVCTKTAARQSEVKDPERVKEIRRARDERNAEKVAEQKRRWQQENYEKCLEANREWSKSHRRSMNAKHSKFKKEHPEYVALHNHTRRARKYGVGYEKVTAVAWTKVLEYYDYRCAYCFRSADKLEQEHIIPLSRGGTHTISNLVPSCGTCNLSKGTKTAEEWIIMEV